VFWEVVCALVFKGDESVTWGEFKGYIGAIAKSHSDLCSEDWVEGVVCLDINCDSMEPLHVVVADTNKFFLAFKVESPQEFVVTPVFCQLV
jgi:hypothetical protein